MRFDTAEQEFALETSDSEVEEAALELQKLDADRAVQAAQDEVNLLKARFDVRKAELDVTTNELLAEVDARKNELTLEESRRKLAQIEEDVQFARKDERGGARRGPREAAEGRARARSRASWPSSRWSCARRLPASSPCGRTWTRPEASAIPACRCPTTARATACRRGVPC